METWNFRTLVCIPTHLFDTVVYTSLSTLGSLVLIRLVRIGTPVTLMCIATSFQHCDPDSFTRLLLLDTITGMSTTLLHELDLWDLSCTI